MNKPHHKIICALVIVLPNRFHAPSTLSHYPSAKSSASTLIISSFQYGVHLHPNVGIIPLRLILICADINDWRDYLPALSPALSTSIRRVQTQPSPCSSTGLLFCGLDAPGSSNNSVRSQSPALECGDYSHPNAAIIISRLILVGADVNGCGAVVVAVHYPRIAVQIGRHTSGHITVIPRIYTG